MPISIENLRSQPNLPLYLKIAGAIEEKIKTGALAEGQRLPSHRDLAQSIDVAIGSVAKAYLHLVDQGLVTSKVGQGTVVNAQVVDDRLNLSTDSSLVDMRLVVYPPIDDLPLVEEAGRKSMMETGANWALLQHFGTTSNLAHAQGAAAGWLRDRNVPATAESTIITNGVQEATLAALLTYARNSTPVLTEQLTVNAFKRLCATTGNPLHGVEMDAEGILPEALSEAAVRTGAKLLVTQPQLHVPTVSRMSERRREQIAEVARNHGLKIAEVGTYGIYGGPPGTPFAELLPDQAIYLLSFSDEVAPGLRCGFVHCAAHLRQRLEATRQATTLATSTLVTELTYSWIKSGVAKRIIDTHLTELAARQAIVADVLQNLSYSSTPTSPFIWLKLPNHRAADFVELMQANGVRMLSSDRFAVNKGYNIDAVRIAISSPSTREALSRGLSMIRDFA